MGHQDRPAEEGVVAGDTVLDENGFVPKYPLAVGAAESLAALTAEYAFFTPAVLYLYGGFTDAPLADFANSRAGDFRIYYKLFDRPLFRGLEAPSNGDRAWNHALWAVGRGVWDAFSTFLLSLTLADAAGRFVYGVGARTLSVPDPIAGRPGVAVEAFGVNGSLFRAGLAPAPLAVDRPRLVKLAPDPAMVAFAAAWFGGGNPVAAAEAHRQKESADEDPSGDRP